MSPEEIDSAMKNLPAIPFSRTFRFCSVIRVDHMPPEVADWELYTTDAAYRGETVNLVYVFADEALCDAIREGTDIREEYAFFDHGPLPFIDADAQEGLVILVLPRGA